MTKSPEELATWATDLYKRVPEVSWQNLCDSLMAVSKEASVEQVLAVLPGNMCGDVHYDVCSYLRESAGKITWAELGYRLKTVGVLSKNFADQVKVELLWSGPPSGILEARRTDQVLYDLINAAKSEILIVTFAAAKVSYLKGVLLAAAQRGIDISMVLEFEQESGGQLRIDAIAAFPELASVASIYQWPFEKREKNTAGNPGKLHAKCAVIDESVVIGSANLTADAFTRNMEIGLLVKRPQLADQIREHFKKLIESRVLQLWK
jgi:cardiolipin synthase